MVQINNIPALVMNLLDIFSFAISGNEQICKIVENSLTPTMWDVIIWTNDG